ncbi:MAG: protein kinase [Gemmataceae bacterium]
MTTDHTLTDLLARWEERWEHGDDVPAAELCGDRPELVAALQRKIDRLKRMAWMTASDGDPDQPGADAPDPLVGTTLDARFVIEAFIAEGGFGRVYRATDPDLRRPVAVKVARRGKGNTGAADLLDEARRVARLRHPGIVPVIDVGGAGDKCYIVSALIDGPDLATASEGERFGTDEAARLTAAVADALHYAHVEGFVHRDIKPENILLDGARRPLLTDFGLAASPEEVIRREGSRCGTLAYMAPEQVAGEVQLVGPRSDIYSLGVVLYELLTGRLPYQARTPGAMREQILFRPPVPPRALNPGIPEHLEAVCLRCLSKLPADRYPTAAELAAALRAAPPRRWLRLPLRWVWIVLIVVGLFVAGVVLGMALSTPSSQTAPRAAVSPEPGMLTFNGTSRIVTLVEPFLPCTLEAWVRPTGDRQEQFIVGSDVPNFYGLGLGLNENRPCVETIRGGFRADPAILPGTWTHLTAVFSPEETRLYINGQKVGVGPASQPPKKKTRFVIGNVGQGHDKLFFRGHVRAVRITKGERYNGDFLPDEAFTKDGADVPAKAVLIYNGATGEGDRVIDRSGAGNDGRWERTEP